MTTHQKIKEIKTKRVRLQKEKVKLKKAILVLDKEIAKVELQKVREDIKNKKS